MASPPHEQALRQVAAGALRLVAGCTTAAVAFVPNERPTLVVGSSSLGRELEELQWGLGQGPSVDAVGQLQVFNVTSVASARSWPAFTAAAAARGVASMLAVPVIARSRAIGALGLYSPHADAFSGHEPSALQYAAWASLALSGLVAREVADGRLEPLDGLPAGGTRAVS